MGVLQNRREAWTNRDVISHLLSSHRTKKKLSLSYSMDVTDMPDQPSRRSDAAKSGYSGIEETKSEVGRQEQERLEELELNV